MEKYSINIADDFSPKLGGRYRTIGEFSGEEFFDKLLNPKYYKARSENEKLHIYMDGASPYGSSFIDQSFGELGRKYGVDSVKETIVFHTTLFSWVVNIIQTELWKK